MTETCTISLTPEGKIIFKELTKKMPGFTFSGMLREVSRHYIICNSKGVRYTPEYLGDIQKWRRYISKMDKKELKEYQQRNLQISNLLRKRTETWL